MPRVCNREGCGRPLVKKDGSPDLRRHFCGRDCKNVDKRERMQAQRAKFSGGKCPRCGRKSAQDSNSNYAVPRHTAPGNDVNGSDEGIGGQRQLESSERL